MTTYSRIRYAAKSKLRRSDTLRAVAHRLHRKELRTRAEEIAKFTPGPGRILEIGPFFSPLARGPDVAYADVLGADELRARAIALGDDPSGVPKIDFLVPPNDLSSIHETFRACVSSHVIEHQPDLIGHLQQVGRLLQAGGRYVLIVPDRRYCFDHYLPSSTLAEMVAAHVERRERHTLRSVIEHRALTVHNDAARHWAGDHGRPIDNFASRLAAAVSEFNTGDRYVDVHAWQFDPRSFGDLMTNLFEAGQSPFKVETILPTRRDTFEFLAVLVLAAQAAG